MITRPQPPPGKNHLQPVTDELTIRTSDDQLVSARVTRPSNPLACYVLAHGAGAGMNHPFLAGVAEGLAERGIATLRYQFPFAEKGSRRPDRAPLAQATVRAAIAAAARHSPSLPLIAGGKSFGGRMTSQAQAEAALARVVGLAFLGFPLHPAGKPSVDRAAHLSRISIPMLFLQGTRDALAQPSLLTASLDHLGPLATLKLLDGADHGFHVLARSGRDDRQVMGEMLDALCGWVTDLCGGREGQGAALDPLGS